MIHGPMVSGLTDENISLKVARIKNWTKTHQNVPKKTPLKVLQKAWRTVGASILFLCPGDI